MPNDSVARLCVGYEEVCELVASAYQKSHGCPESRRRRMADKHIGLCNVQLTIKKAT
jgi:hypothetical protein